MWSSWSLFLIPLNQSSFLCSLPSQGKRPLALYRFSTPYLFVSLKISGTKVKERARCAPLVGGRTQYRAPVLAIFWTILRGPCTKEPSFVVILSANAHENGCRELAKEGLVKGESTNNPIQNLIQQRQEVLQNLFVADICTTKKNMACCSRSWSPCLLLAQLICLLFISVLSLYLAVAGASAAYGQHMKIGPYRRLFAKLRETASRLLTYSKAAALLALVIIAPVMFLWNVCWRRKEGVNGTSPRLVKPESRSITIKGWGRECRN